MPRKELLVMGFRHGKQVGKCLAARRAAHLLAIRKLHATGVAPKAAAHKGSQAGQSAASKVGRRKEPAATTSFAASALADATAPSAGKLGGLSLLKSTSALLGRAVGASPSFAATPFFGKPSALSSGATAQAAAAAACKPAAVTPHAVPAAVRSNPLYRFAKLGEAQQQVSAPSAAGKAAEAGQADSALLKYAKLGAPAAKPMASKKLSEAAALLKYAKLK